MLLLHFSPYVQYLFLNQGGTDQTDFFFNTKFLITALTPQVLGLDSYIAENMTSVLSRSVLVGQNDNKEFTNVPVTQEGHLEVSLHDPKLPFGSIHFERLTPEFQSDPIYGLNPHHVDTSSSGSGSVTATNQLFSCSTGTTIYSQGVMLSRKRLKYRPGQGVVGRFTAIFSTPVPFSYQIAGLGHAEDGVYFGYGNTNNLPSTDFGILYVNRGLRQIVRVKITTGSTSAESITVTLNGVAFGSIAVTNNGNIDRTVWEISQGTYNGWRAFPLKESGGDNYVYFVASSAGLKNNAYSITVGGTGITYDAFDTTVQTGQSSTDLFIPQSSWNGDKLDGTCKSGVVIDPTKGNVFAIFIQYLGFGPIQFFVEVAPEGNDSYFTVVHTLRFPNSRTQTTFSNPSFPFTMAAYSAGSTTDLTISSGSISGFIEGEKKLHGNRFSFPISLSSVSTGTKVHLLSIQNSIMFQGVVNQSIVNIVSISGALAASKPANFTMIKDAQLTGNPSFSFYATHSCLLYDTTSTEATENDNGDILFAFSLGGSGNFSHIFPDEITLQPGEMMTFVVEVGTSSNDVYFCVNVREDH